MVGVRVVKIHSEFYKAKTQDAGVKIDVALGVACYRGHVMDSWDFIRAAACVAVIFIIAFSARFRVLLSPSKFWFLRLSSQRSPQGYLILSQSDAFSVGTSALILSKILGFSLHSVLASV